METILDIFVFLCMALGAIVMILIVGSAIANFTESFKRWNKERKQKKKFLPEPLATLVSVDLERDSFYVTVKCPKGGNHFSTLISHLDVSEYVARFTTTKEVSDDRI